jgi:hypothetical protein
MANIATTPAISGHIATSTGASAPTIARRDDKPETGPVSLSALPFVYRPKRGFKNASHWRVPPTDDYGLACKTGMEYGAHFAQYLKDNPYRVGSNALGRIAEDIDFKDETGASGYWVGFFSFLEQLIYASARQGDVFAYVDRLNASYAEMEAEAQRARDAETGED